MVLVILLTNVLIRKREMMKATQKEEKHIKAKEPHVVGGKSPYRLALRVL
jgi:hypothetical protein